MSVIDDIRAARDHLAERGWNKGSVEGDDGQVCAMGALNLACFGTARPSRVELNPRMWHQLISIAQLSEYEDSMERRQRAIYELHKHLPQEYDELAEFNDAEPTVEVDVFMLFDKTLANLGAP